MNTLLKAALAGAGLYLMVRYTGIKVPFLQEPEDDPAPTEPKIPGVTTPPPPPPPPPPPAGGYSQAEKDQIAIKAAKGDQTAIAKSIALGMKFSADVWNFYNGGTTTVDLFPEGDRGFLMNAEEYWQRRRAAGLSGIRMGW